MSSLMIKGAYFQSCDWGAQPCIRHQTVRLCTLLGYQDHVSSCGWTIFRYQGMDLQKFIERFNLVQLILRRASTPSE